MVAPVSKFVDVDGVKTHYLEAGSGPDVVLLHGGEFGANAELSWESTIPALAEHFHVVAPDFLGFGQTDKLFDFVAPAPRRIRHISRFLSVMGIKGAHFAGSSMGGSFILQVCANQPDLFNPASGILIAGGGILPDNEARRTLFGYDGSRAGMKALVDVLFEDPKYGRDDAYVDRRHRASIEPGAWESVYGIQLRAPAAPKGPPPAPPEIRYADIKTPMMLIAGARDKLRTETYAPELAGRIPGCELHVFQDAGHLVQIEKADEVNRLLIDYIKRIEAKRK